MLDFNMNIDELVTLIFLVMGFGIIMYTPFGVTRSARKIAKENIKKLGLPPEAISSFPF